MHFLVRRRVPISIAVFGILMIEDVVTGTVPHDVFDWTDYRSVVGLLSAARRLDDALLGGRLSDQEHATDDDRPLSAGAQPALPGVVFDGRRALPADRRSGKHLDLRGGLGAACMSPRSASEEHFLASKFPSEWPQYAASTPRFLPRLTAWPSLSGWRLSQWLKSREYNAVVATLAAIVALKALHDMHS